MWKFLLEFWKPISLVSLLLGLYHKGRRDQVLKDKNVKIQEDLETIKRIQNVKTNLDRKSSLNRMRKNNQLR